MPQIESEDEDPGGAPHQPNRRDFLNAALGVGVMGTMACGVETMTTEVPGQIRAVDIHIHAEATDLPGLKPKPPDVEELYKRPAKEMADRLNAEMPAGGLQYAFGMGSLDKGEDDPLGIKKTLEVCKSVPGLRVIGALDPRKNSPAHFKRVEAQIEANRDKLVAFKAYLGYLHFGPEDPAYEPYYKLAERYKIPVIFHTGDNWSTTAKVKFAHPLRVDEVAVDHPDVTFILAHMGNPWLVDAAEVIFKNPNVGADLSGLFVGDSKAFQALFEAARAPDSAAGLILADVRKALAYCDAYDRIFYGSDWPLAGFADYRKLIELLVPKEHHAKVFRENAVKLFNLKP